MVFKIPSHERAVCVGHISDLGLLVCPKKQAFQLHLGHVCIESQEVGVYLIRGRVCGETNVK